MRLDRFYEAYDMAVRDSEIGRIAAVLYHTDTAPGFIEAGCNVKIVSIVKNQ